jgi:hypothetical protein
MGGWDLRNLNASWRVEDERCRRAMETLGHEVRRVEVEISYKDNQTPD